MKAYILIYVVSLLTYNHYTFQNLTTSLLEYETEY